MAEVFLWKAIKPAKLKVDAIRLELLNALRKEGRVQLKDFEKTVATWDHGVEFEMLISLSGGGPQLLVGTDDAIYGYVNEGTKPHIIRPVNAPRLAFQGQYTPKTVPGVIGSKSGGSSGDMVYANSVQHPGTQARDFDEIIQKKNQRRFKRAMQDAMTKGAEKAGLR
jgi:hypothetical protein